MLWSRSAERYVPLFVATVSIINNSEIHNSLYAFSTSWLNCLMSRDIEHTCFVLSYFICLDIPLHMALHKSSGYVCAALARPLVNGTCSCPPSTKRRNGDKGNRKDNPNPVDKRADVRDIRVEKHDYEAYGYTDGCPGCTWMRTDKIGPRKHHTEECRNRMKVGRL